MMSILLFTLLSWLHCQPPLPIPNVSLLPVAYVESSPVQNVVEVELSVQFAPHWGRIRRVRRIAVELEFQVMHRLRARNHEQRGTRDQQHRDPQEALTPLA